MFRRYFYFFVSYITFWYRLEWYYLKYNVIIIWKNGNKFFNKRDIRIDKLIYNVIC